MSNPAHSKTRGGGFRAFAHFMGFRIVPVFLFLAALMVSGLKLASGEILLGIADQIGDITFKLVPKDWLIVIVMTIIAMVLLFAGVVFSPRPKYVMKEAAAAIPASKWRDGVKIDKTKCARSQCRGMRLAGKLLCPECTSEWKRQTPLRCAECGDENINQNTNTPLCKLCHQRWLDT
ncbi:MAG: hypothetical protein ACR2P4_02320 [Gammaproteobacteria bacterium]